MNSSQLMRSSVTVLSLAVLASCATWREMDRSEKGTAVGATGGAVVGAAVGGPVGAAVGAGVGGYAGHYEAGGPPSQSPSTSARGPAPASSYDADVVRSAQASLRDRGYDPGSVDGVWGPNTETALRRFQQANGLTQTGALDNSTLNALGVR